MRLSTRILIAFSVVIILSVTDSYTNYLLSLQVKQNAEFFNKSEAIIRNSTKLHKAIIEMQSAFRGFLLTRDTSFLDTYEKGVEVLPALFAEQKTLISENFTQLILLDSIYQLHEEWMDYSNKLIEAKKKVDISEKELENYNYLFENKLRKQTGKKINDRITRKFLAFDKSEYRLRDIHGKALAKSIQHTHTISFIFLSLTVIVGIISTVYIVTFISKRINTMVRLAANISKGDFAAVNDTRNDELSRLSSSLNVMSANLKKSINELEQRNAELDKFAHVVSHDLKAPLRGIHNAVKWIEEDLQHELSPQLKEYLGIIPHRIKRMESLINGLLDYARLRETMKPETTDVSQLVKEIVASIVPRDFQVEIQSLPVFDTERLKLEQVFTNLISNAVKYTPHPYGRIVISCQIKPSYYLFSVKDNGIGIDPEYHEKIFELFQTLREKNEKESTGIGLAIIKKIIDDKHGTIKVNSTLGKGAEFVFSWPRNNEV